jgi:hypothetical protein
VREAFFPSSGAQVAVEPARPEDGPAIREIVERHDPPGRADAVLRWWERLPESFTVARDALPLSYLERASSRLRLTDFEGKETREVVLPASGELLTLTDKLRDTVMARIGENIPGQVSGHADPGRHHVGFEGLPEVGHRPAARVWRGSGVLRRRRRDCGRW